MIFASSALLFRYHVFEREVFAVVPVLASRAPGLAARTGGRQQPAAASQPAR